MMKFVIDVNSEARALRQAWPLELRPLFALTTPPPCFQVDAHAEKSPRYAVETVIRAIVMS